MIEQFSIYELLFKEINQITNREINIYVIGGAVLLYRDMKPATKDIDIVVDTKAEFNELVKVLKQVGFESFSPLTGGYQHFKLSEQFKRESTHIDIFLREVCSKFLFSKTMIDRSENIISLDKIKVYLSSNEDVFSFKTMTDRPGDLDDCISLAQRGLDWDVIFSEILFQIEKSGKDIWITWVNERLIDLEEKGVVIPILKKTNKLAIEFMKNKYPK
jgi:hypothetical protein